MNPKGIILTTLLIGVVGLLVYVWSSARTTNTAPDLSAQSSKGQNINFAHLSRKKPVLVAFWATSCASCLKEMPHLITLYQDLHDKGMELISVTMDYDIPIHVVAMIKEHGIPYPVVMDLDKRIMRAFGMSRGITPTTFLIAPGGKIVMRKTGLLDIQALRQQISGYL